MWNIRQRPLVKTRSVRYSDGSNKDKDNIILVSQFHQNRRVIYSSHQKDGMWYWYTCFIYEEQRYVHFLPMKISKISPIILGFRIVERRTALQIQFILLLKVTTICLRYYKNGEKTSIIVDYKKHMSSIDKSNGIFLLFYTSKVDTLIADI